MSTSSRFTGLLTSFALLFVLLERAAAQDVTTSVYVRTDTDHTTVVTPRVRAGSKLGSASRVDLTYSADVWTSASIDIRSSASKAITEQRDELNVGASHELEDGTLSASYRFSTEPDYKSHGVTLGASRDFARKNTSLALSGSALFDRVGRAGDPGFSRDLQTFVLRASGTQILDNASWLQLLYELGYATGYLASPYRFVGIGTDSPRCSAASSLCVREALPDERVRNAVALIARRALGEGVSLGASYRFYIDGWRLNSHTAQLIVSVMPAQTTRLSLDYRFYTQSAARYYQVSTPNLASLGRFTTRDKELSPFMSHALTLTLDQTIPFGLTGAVHLALAAGPTVYLFSDFFAYDHLYAFESTLAVRAEL
ncbi:MAG TPA: DUF3570 domain-containing protein [Polyangiales bacterium]|nr:DUF3570 domain-containing protein [Polyangiales bacterium]